MSERTVEVIAAELSITGSGEHLEDAITHFEHADVEGAAAQIIDGDLLMLVELVEAVGECGGGGLAEDALDGEAGEFARFLRGGTLSVVEEGGHSDDRTAHRLLQGTSGDRFEVAQDFGGDFDGA
jgi:hypothetical protein